ncbi:MAG TPA: hypothetical protein VNJ51_07940 [Candidatus Dormibacteraeota bacterium]|nr:hypothetical protein [Candidatus Dormibacteraeota bacterium]
MRAKFISRIVPLALAGTLCAAPAAADPGLGTALSQQLIPSVNGAIKAAIRSERAKPPGQVAQVPPIPPSTKAPAQTGLPTGWTYTTDLSMAWALGNTGASNKLPGGFDAGVGYGFNATTRIQASYYEVQHYPLGFNTGSVPLYLQGVANPVGAVDLSQNGPNVTTKDAFTLVMFQKLVRLDHKLPVVITPTYVSRTSSIGGTSDLQTLEVNGFPLQVQARTAQVEAVAFTLPFLSTPKMFGTFTVAPAWLVHRAGLNQENHAQLYQILYLEYRPTRSTTIFLEPQSSRDYLPADVYAQHLNAYFLGISHRLTRNTFVQAVLNSGGPSNYQPYGLTGIYCQQLVPCSQQAITAGGLHATQIQLQFGIGTPSVLPF